MTHKVSYYTLAISYCTFCVGKHTILGPEAQHCFRLHRPNHYTTEFIQQSHLCVCPRTDVNKNFKNFFTFHEFADRDNFVNLLACTKFDTGIERVYTVNCDIFPP